MAWQFHSTPENESALKIQGAVRQYQARAQLKQKVNWEINENLEYSEEQSTQKLRDMFQRLLDASDSLSPGLAAAIERLQAPVDEEELLRSTNRGSINVGSDYDGPCIDGPITPGVFIELIRAFQSGQILHEKYVWEILDQALAVLKTLPNFNHVDLSSLGHVTVVGDLHGQLADLLHIFNNNGLPSADNAYVFNGDFVDRGRNSVEILLLLLVALILYPSTVFLNRGNHEDISLSDRFGFHNEVKRKYTTNENRLMDLFKGLFSWLPILSIIKTGKCKIIVMHGGISHQVHLSKLESLPRNQYFSMEIPPKSRTGSQKLTEEERDEFVQLQDLLWSDPNPTSGAQGYKKNDRGIGYFFGFDITEQFLNRYNLSMIIRSHQVKEKGYEYRHNSKVLTVFSASNYENTSNAGAVVRLEYNNRDPKIFQHQVPQGTMETLRLNTQGDDPTYQSLMQKIVANKRTLLAAFKQADKEQNGRVSIRRWEFIMSHVLQMHIPWLTIRSKLVREDSGGVLYETMFDRYTVNNSRYQNLNSNVMEDLYQWKDILWALFNVIDANHSGSINRDEFAEIIRIIFGNQNTDDVNLYDYIDELICAMDKDGNGRIDFDEFFEGFQLVHAQ